MRVGAVDLGTNSTRLLVADVDGERVEALVRRTTVTRLGQGVDASRLLLPAAIERVHAALREFRRELDALGATRVLAVATSAVRDAANGGDFLRGVEEAFGIPTRLVDGDEEARLTRLGVGALDDGDARGGRRRRLDRADPRRLPHEPRRRLDAAHRAVPPTDPPTADELAAARAYVAGLLPPLDVERRGRRRRHCRPARTAGRPAHAGAVEAQLARLASLPVAERRDVPGLDPARAPVIVGGAVVVAEVLRAYGLDVLAFSVRDLLDGIALLAANG